MNVAPDPETWGVFEWIGTTFMTGLCALMAWTHTRINKIEDDSRLSLEKTRNELHTQIERVTTQAREDNNMLRGEIRDEVKAIRELLVAMPTKDDVRHLVSLIRGNSRSDS